MGPYEVVRQGNPITYELKLPSHMKIHPVFHVSPLRPAVTGLLDQGEVRVSSETTAGLSEACRSPAILGGLGGVRT